MQATDDAHHHRSTPTSVRGAARNHDATVFVALELSASQWLVLVAANIPGSQKI
jgi:hypothetical protein